MPSDSIPPLALGPRVAPISGFPDYLACEDGSVWSKNPGRWRRRPVPWRRLIASPGRKGYRYVRLAGHTRKVHRVILEAFVGPCPPGMECRHLDGDVSNNRLGNICWGSCRENTEDKRRHGTLATGVRNGKAKLNPAQVVEIRAAYAAGGTSYAKLGQRYGVAGPTVRQIVHRSIWRMV